VTLPPLHPWQERAVADFDRYGGVFVVPQPGEGKTLVGALCAAKCARPLVLVKASNLKQTARMFEGYGVTHAMFASYNALSLDEPMLDRLNPDCLVVDEADMLKNVRKTAWARRVARYLHDFPRVRVVVLTGSVMHKSALDYLHLLVWALRKNPLVRASSASIERVAKWADEHPAEWLEKLRDCPGVHFGDGRRAWAGELTLTITRLPPAAPDEYERAQTVGEAPDGWPLEDRWSREECLRQLAWGFALVRSPRPSKRLLAMRRVWARYVKQAIEYHGVDTEMLAREVFPDAYAAYLAVEQSEPASEQRVEWFGCAIPGTRPGTLVWVNHIALGERLSRLTGWPYHREGARDAAGVYLGDQTAPVAIASIAACHRGVDGAQLRYNRHVVLEPPADARVWEQLLGRLARQGQPSSTVHVEVVLRCPEHEAAFASALEQARGIEEATRQSQLLLRARHVDG
jgi:hypothetical protein